MFATGFNFVANALSAQSAQNSVGRSLADAVLVLSPLFLVLALLAIASLLVRVIRRRRLGRSGITEIDRFGGETFERYLEILFRRLGYAVERTRFVGDYGGDLVIRRDGVRTVVQAKRYRKQIGVRAVQEAVAAKGYYDCSEAMVVSNSHYTRAAVHLARKNDVVLWDREELVQRLASAHAKDRIQETAIHGSSSHGVDASPQSDVRRLATVEACRTCAKILSAGERQYCERNARRFGGRMLCFRHQRTITKS